jgi:chaperonin cofactor prefoldin
MFDRGTFGRSTRYFAYLQQLRIFVEWINETKKDLPHFMECYENWYEFLEDRYKHNLPVLEVLISQGERDWMKRQVHETVDNYTKRLTALQDRIDKKKKEIESLRDGVRTYSTPKNSLCTRFYIPTNTREYTSRTH